MSKQFQDVYCPTGCKVVGITVAVLLTAAFLHDVITKIRDAVNEGRVDGVDGVLRTFTKKGDQSIRTSLEVQVSYNPGTGTDIDSPARITKSRIANAMQTLAATDDNIRDAVQKCDSSFIGNYEAQAIATAALFGAEAHIPA